MSREEEVLVNHEIPKEIGKRAFLKSLFRRVPDLLAVTLFAYGRITAPGDSDVRLGDFARMEQQGHNLDVSVIAAALGRVETPLTTPHGKLPPDPFLGDAYLKKFNWLEEEEDIEE